MRFPPGLFGRFGWSSDESILVVLPEAARAPGQSVKCSGIRSALARSLLAKSVSMRAVLRDH
ncbi:MAG: hypothetical protein ACXWJB_06630 [Limisphaerales bacterium]